MKECLFGNPIHNKKQGCDFHKKTRNTSSTIRVCSSFFMMIESIKTFSTPEQTKPRQLLVPEGFGTAQSQELLTLQHQ